MRLRILGSGAGGGVPQWNCNCHNCARLRAGTLEAPFRTQSSLAVSDGSGAWALINTSPDIRQQLLDFPALQPGRAARDTAIAAVLLTDAQIDHVTGLLTLREGERLPLYCTEPVHADLSGGFPIITLLAHYCGVDWRPVVPGEAFQVPGLALRFTPVPLDSKAPPYSPHRHDPHPGDNVGFLIEHEGRAAFYAPDLGRLDGPVRRALDGADCLLVDGTFWSEDEMVRYGVGSKPARAMGHLPLSGAGGLLAALAASPARRKLLVHINNTNPILDPASPERAELEAAGVEVAVDRQEIEL